MKIDEEDADEDEYKGGFLSLRFFPVRGLEERKRRSYAKFLGMADFYGTPVAPRESERERTLC